MVLSPRISIGRWFRPQHGSRGGHAAGPSLHLILVLSFLCTWVSSSISWREQTRHHTPVPLSETANVKPGPRTFWKSLFGWRM